MTSVSARRAAAARTPRAARATPEAAATLDAGSLAWLCVVPVAVLSALIIYALGPPLADLLYPARNPFTFLNNYQEGVNPEPNEQARFLLSLSAPVLLAAATVAAVRIQARGPPRVPPLAIPAIQAALGLLLVACLVVQYRLRFGLEYTRRHDFSLTKHYFKPLTLVVASLLAAGVVLAIRDGRVRATGARWIKKPRAYQLAAWAVGAAMTVVWMLHAVNSDESIARSLEAVSYHIGFHLDEAFAVINGLTPLVDFTAQYGSLWPYVSALAMLVFGKTLLTFTLVMATLTALAMLALFGVLRYVTRSWVAALPLYLPVLATSFFLIEGTLVNRYTFGSYFATFPLRAAGPYFLAWLTARRLYRGRSGYAWPLFAVAGLVALNNVDYGVPALGATLAALIWTTERWDATAARRLAASVAAGLALALALVSLLTLVRAGSLPQLGRLVQFARLYTVGGFADLPMPGVLGMHLAIYLTYVAAIGTATALALQREANRALVGMLAWSGVFGLGSAGYYVGRSHPESLIATFSMWSLTLALLTVVVVRQLAASPARRPGVAAIAVLFGMGLAACSLVQAPAPWSQLDRIREPVTVAEAAKGLGTREPLLPPAESGAREFISSLAYGPRRFALKRGAPVALFLTNGHRIADAYGIRDVVPFSSPGAIQSVEQLDQAVAALRRAGGNTMIFPTDASGVDPQVFRLLSARGFKMVTGNGLQAPDKNGVVVGAALAPWFNAYLMKWVDTRHLHPRALTS